VPLFFAGGAADMTWHLVFGVESGLGALLSPTHLLLLVSGWLALSGPLRAVWRRDDPAPSLITLLPGVLSAATITAVVLFGLSYLSGFVSDAPTLPYRDYPEGTPQHFAVETPAVAGLGGYVVTSAVLVLAALALLRRWRTPFGTITVLVLTQGVLATVLADFAVPGVVVATAAAGLAADIVLTVTYRRGAPAPLARTAAVTTIPAVLWPAQLMVLQMREGVHWTAELIGGVISVTVILSAALALTQERAPVTTRPVSPRSSQPSGT
jgi:hypothetical protein